jgi:hypothetical protein
MSISKQIITELEEKFEKHPVWVWYDPRQKFKGIVDEVKRSTEDGNTHVEVFEGSYLELKRRIWEQDPDIDEDWLFYIDESRQDADWFRDIHRLGKEYRPRVDLSDDPAAKYLVERTDEIPDDFDMWRTDPEQLTRTFFTVVFHRDRYNPKEFVIEFFERPDEYAERIDKYQKGDDWEDLLHDEYGIDGRFNPVEIAEQILFGEVQATSPTKRFTELSSDKPKKVQELCDFWQRHQTNTYLELSKAIGQEYDIEGAVLESQSLDWGSEAFKQVDDGLLGLCLSRIEDTAVMELQGETEELLDVIDRRKQGFWYKDGHTDYWDVLQHGLRVVEEGSEARDEVTREYRDPKELGQRYTEDWWTVDREYRKYVRAQSSLVEAYDGLDRIGEKITHHYTEFVKQLNRELAEGIQGDPRIGTPQTEFHDKYVSNEDGTAILICDALRYELACELIDSLDDTDADIEADYVSASLPSVTRVGMSSHLGDISLEIDGDLKVSKDGEDTNRKSDRVEKFKNLGFEVSDLSDIINSQTSDIEERGLTPRIIYSGTIDEMGEKVDDDEALTQAVDHVEKVETAIRKLLSAGYHNFVVTSDHGFLYTETLPDDLKIDSPNEAEITKRRFSISKEPGSENGSLVSLDTDDMESLGIETEGLVFQFPRSVACFSKRGGNMRYFHGGISIQEMAVPCLTVEAEAKEDEQQKVEIDINFPTSVTNNIVTVEISPEGQMSLSDSRKVILRAKADGEEVCEPKEVTVQTEEKASLRLKSGKLGDASSISFEALDGETREMIEEQRAKVDMVIEDEGFDI